MTSLSKNVYRDKLEDILENYNNKYHNTTKMKLVDVKSSTYIDSSKDINNKDHKFKVGGIARISKYKTIFAKGYVPNWSEEVFVIKKVKSTVPWTYIISGLKDEQIVRTFSKRNCKNQIKKNLELKK